MNQQNFDLIWSVDQFDFENIFDKKTLFKEGARSQWILAKKFTKKIVCSMIVVQEFEISFLSSFKM